LSNNADRFFVLTGGPGSGKSTVIGALRRSGYAGCPEAGRAVIQEQMAAGGRALPWDDRLLFAEMMLRRDEESYRAAEKLVGRVYFDRGVVDVVGYLRLVGLPVPKHMEQSVESYRYNRMVFVAPPWPEIYGRDNERKQDFAEAVRTYETMVTTYADYGYQVVEIPRDSIESRMRFVLDESASRTGV